jgi:hypothetical protein
MLDDQILNMKMKVKLRQLIKICPQLRKIFKKFCLRMQEEHVPNVCKVGTHHKNDFDEVMFIVQVCIGKCEIMDVLLDDGSKVNIIYEHMWRKLGLKKPQLVPFMVIMVDQRKVQLVGLIRNLKINSARCTFKISMIVLQMEDTPKACSMFLGRPWLKQAKAHHDLGNNTLTIIVDTNIMTLNMEKQVMVHPSQRPYNFDDTYN